MYYNRAVSSSNQHGLGEGEKEGEIWFWGRHQQETKHATPSTAATTSTTVPPREARGGHLQDKHGKEAQGETPRTQEQPGQYIHNLKLNSEISHILFS